jgi:hypothetical protein
MSRRQQGNNRRIINTSRYEGVPDEYTCKLQYSYAVADSTGAYGEVILRGNGPYDPEYAAGGGQPQWWDQLSAIYTHYEAFKSKVTAKVIQRSATGDSAFLIVGMYPHIDPSTATAVHEACERDRSRHEVMGPNVGGPNTMTIIETNTTSQIYGIPKELAKYETDYSALTSTTPNNQWYHHIFYGTLNEFDDTSVYIDIEVEYWIRFFGKINIGTSWYLKGEGQRVEHLHHPTCNCEKCQVEWSTTANPQNQVRVFRQ